MTPGMPRVWDTDTALPQLGEVFAASFTQGGFFVLSSGSMDYLCGHRLEESVFIVIVICVCS